MTAPDEHQLWQCHVENGRELKPPAPGLQNCLCVCSEVGLASILCDFGVLAILKCPQNTLIPGASDDTQFKYELVKQIRFGEHVSLQSQSWSPDGEFLVIGAEEKVCVLKVKNDFTQCICYDLYYEVKDVSVTKKRCSQSASKYLVAIAGPDGVEVFSFQDESGEVEKTEDEYEHLHMDLAICLVQFSPDSRCLAVAALDGHFGTWTYKESFSEEKDFWYVLLSTLRISDISFSPDNNLLAAACWDGSCFLYKKTFVGKSVEWKDCHISVDSPVSRISGLCPGSFLSWLPCSRYIRLTYNDANGARITTVDVREQCSMSTLLSGDSDSIKGVASHRSGLLCLRKSMTLGVIPLPHKESSKVLQNLEEILLTETPSGSIWITRSCRTKGTLLKITRFPGCTNIQMSSGDFALSGTIDNNNASSNSDLTCFTRTSGAVVVNCASADVSNVCDEDCCCYENFKSDTTQKYATHLSDGGCALEQSVPEQEKDAIEEILKPCANCIKCQSREYFQGNKRAFLATQLDSGTLNDSSCTRLSDNTKKKCAIENGGSSFDREHDLCEGIVGCLHLDEHSMSLSNNSNITEQESREMSMEIRVPFLDPEFLLDVNCRACSEHSLDSEHAVILMSSKVLVIALFPLVAYIFGFERQWWKALTFYTPVIAACLVSEALLVCVSIDMTIRVFDCLVSETVAQRPFQVDRNPKCCHLISSENGKSALLVLVQESGEKRVWKFSFHNGLKTEYLGSSPVYSAADRQCLAKYCCINNK